MNSPLAPLPRDEDEALGIVEAGEAVGIPTAAVLLKSVAVTLGQPRSVRREVRRFGRDTVRIVAGKSDRTPSKGDRRFTDPAWTDNPLFRRMGQEYLSACESLASLVDDLEQGNRTWQEAERARFVMNILMSAIAPTNLLPTNPAALKLVFDTGGRSIVRGAQNFLHDVRRNGGMPSQTDRTAFQVGTDLAATPGWVVQRDALAELIQYSPTTPTVRQRPILIIPPPIGRYYFLDLRPGRSFVEYGVSRGLQVFMLSWRNPTRGMGDTGVDDYAQRLLSALDAVRDITGSEQVGTVGFCAGGILMSGVLNHLMAMGDDRVHAASFAVTLLDFDSRAALGAFSRAAPSRTRAEGLASSRCHHRPQAKQCLCLDASRRPGLQLLGQQLPDGQFAVGVRHSRLECRQHEPARGAAPAVPRHLQEQHADHAGRGHDPGYTGRSRRHHRAKFRDGCAD